MGNSITIKLADGKEIVAELCNYDNEHPEIVICLRENGIAVQDVCIVRPDEESKKDVECLVWSDELSEDYTHKFIIPQYKEG